MSTKQRAADRDKRILAALSNGATYDELATEYGIARDSVRTIAYRARKRANLTRVWVAPAPVVRVGQLPAGPMEDRRTKRNRDRSSVERHAVDDQLPLL